MSINNTGSTGTIYRQFSVTIVTAMLLSVAVALILTPALCATVLRRPPAHAAARGRTRDSRTAGDAGDAGRSGSACDATASMTSMTSSAARCASRAARFACGFSMRLTPPSHIFVRLFVINRARSQKMGTPRMARCIDFVQCTITLFAGFILRAMRSHDAKNRTIGRAPLY